MTKPRPIWRNGIVGLVALASAALMAFTAATSLGAFTATVANSSNSATSGTIVLHEGTSATTCFSTAASAISTDSNTCAINLFAGMTNAEPGGTPSAVTQTFTNVGSLASSAFSLTAGTCTAAANAATSPYYGTDTSSGFCGKVDVTIENDTISSSPQCLYPAGSGACPGLSNAYNLSTLASSTSSTPLGLGSLAAGATDTLKITVGLDPSAGNPDQGLAASMPLSWELSQ